MRKRINFVIALCIIVVASIKAQESNIEGLTVKFRKVSEDYVLSGPNQSSAVSQHTVGNSNNMSSTSVTFADDGMKFVKLKLTLKNEGEKDCNFDFANVYISTEQDSLYGFIQLQTSFTGTKTKIKPHKEIDRIVFFDFPDKATPKELFIEDKRYRIIVEK